jgi:hypothetical protein
MYVYFRIIIGELTMQSREIMVAKRMLFLLTTAVLTLSGCDKVKSVVDDVKSSTTDSQPSTTVTPPVQAAPSVPAVAPVVSTEPTAEQLLAEFRRVLHQSQRRLPPSQSWSFRAIKSQRGDLNHL